MAPSSSDTAPPILDALADGPENPKRAGLLAYLLAPFRDLDERAVYRAERRAAEAAARKR